ncbi:MAG TPA: hypothetical protein VMG35_30905 [Bryobacteraceae bacterium]|nr:hypothetical protein [Bryobacteraceae bacterium]
MQKRNVYTLSLMTAGLMAFAAVTPARAQNTVTNVRVISMRSPAGVIAPDTKYAGLAETNVSVGIETPGVPCGNCVRQAGTPNVGLPWPVFAVGSGTPLTVSTMFESTSYTGPCTAGIILKQGATVVAAGTYPFPGGCQAGYVYGVFFNLPAPSTTGFTTVIGTISGGANKSGGDTFINVQ